MRILIADDKHLMATGLSNALAAIGHTVVGPVADGEEAVRSACEEDVDMCVLDIRMPRKTGLEAASEIWERARKPTVLLSAYTDDEYVERAAQPGIFGYLVKPVSNEWLRVSLEMARNRFANHEMQHNRIAQLEETLTHRKRVEQAKWRLVDSRGFTEVEAHTHIQRLARDKRTKLIDVAEEILAEARVADTSGV